MDNGTRALAIAAPQSGFRGIFDPEGFFGGTLDQWASLSLILLVSFSVWDRVVPRHNPRANPRRRRRR
jgi:hypothetical protein